MPTSYSDLLRFAKQATGENDGTWGTILNANTLEILEDAIAKVQTVSLTGSGDYTLSTANGSADEARCAALVFTGTPAANRNVILPGSAKIYVVHNKCSAAFSAVLKIGGGATVSVAQNQLAIVYSDGTDVVALVKSNAGGGPSDGSVGTAALADDAVTNAKLAEMATMTIKGNNTGGTANPVDLTATQATAMLNAFVGDSGTGGTKGLVPAPGIGDATKALKGNGTWGTVNAISTRVYKTTPETSTWTVPAGVTKVRITVAAAGGGGHGADDNNNVRAGTGGNSTAAHVPTSTTMVAVGGAGGIWGTGNGSAPTPGTATGGDFNLTGGGSQGGLSSRNGNNAVTDGAPGGLCVKDITVTPADSISYTVGAGGTKLDGSVNVSLNGTNGYIIFEY